MAEAVVVTVVGIWSWKGLRGEGGWGSGEEPYDGGEVGAEGDGG